MCSFTDLFGPPVLVIASSLAFWKSYANFVGPALLYAAIWLRVFWIRRSKKKAVPGSIACFALHVLPSFSLMLMLLM
jgi:hypothetical protein